MQNVVHGVFASWIAESIEESEGEVAARINGKADLCYQIVGRGRSLCAADATW